jgi:hypothetical protein
MKSNKILYKSLGNLLLITISFSIYGQTIKTPKNHTVYVSASRDTPALLVYWEASAANWITINQSNAEKVGQATSNYNCHAYAWHIIDCGHDENCWLSNLGTNLSQYWTNDVYSLTTSTYLGGHKKIYYGSVADHSAVPINAYGKVSSKWGGMGIV